MESISFRCTACRQGLKIAADRAGQKGKCPRCGSVLIVPAMTKPRAAAPSGRQLMANKEPIRRSRPEEKKEPGHRGASESGPEPSTPPPRTTRRPPAEPGRPRPVPARRAIPPGEDVAEYDDDDTREEIPCKKRPQANRRKGSAAADWRKVRLGASLQCYQVWAFIASLVVSVACLVGLLVPAPGFSLALFGVWLVVICLLPLTVFTLELVGSCLFLFAPTRYGARRLAQVYIASEALLLVSWPIFLLLLWRFFSPGHFFSTTLIVFFVVWVVLAIIERFSKPFLFQALARNVKADDLAESWVEYMKLAFGATAFSTLLEAGAFFLIAKSPGAAFVFYPAHCILGLVGICATVWYCRSLFRLRNAIADYLDSR
jgi:hypothetical protein